MESQPLPLGPSYINQGINFALHAPFAKEVAILFLDTNQTVAVTNQTGTIWHYWMPYKDGMIKYQWLVDKKIFFDPFSPELETPHEWGAPWTAASLFGPQDFDWQNIKSPKHASKDLIMYEMHLRGFTKHPSSNVEHPGTFLGMIEKIPYLVDLGINAVELLPIHEFIETEPTLKNPITKERLYNYWGYSTVSFFGLMNRYATSRASIEFKTLVRELHRFGIEVILDVVYNHTYNDEKSPYKQLDKDGYYIINDGNYNNDSGCGNTVRADFPVTRDLILSSLRYYVQEYHVDGFRFDLATVFKAEGDAFVKALSLDPILKDTKLIAEPWDLARYEVGGFYHGDRWSEWNGKYRDTVRSFIKGDDYKKGEFATRIAGSEDLYGYRGTPAVSVNFITVHDGFTLNDLVSYNQKHNEANGEKNRDGLNENVSWNCGFEGATNNPKINSLRLKQQKNFLMALLLAKGTPLLRSGDEMCQTKLGNNNTWCQDNDLSWFRWDRLEENKPFFNFVKKLIEIRKKEPILNEAEFLKHEDIIWHGVHPGEPDWDNNNKFIACSLKNYLYIAFNASSETYEITLPEGDWDLLLSSCVKFTEPVKSPFKMEPYSALILKVHH